VKAPSKIPLKTPTDGIGGGNGSGGVAFCCRRWFENWKPAQLR